MNDDTQIKVLSLFSGVGGFDLGLEQAGMQTVYQCEYDKHATKVLERHWPTVPRWGDITTLTGREVLRHAPEIDLVAWGSPCQDLSVAGKRSGLNGARSGLFYHGMRIIKEIREATNGRYPRISVWENVVGALNSNRGADFGSVLDAMAKAGALVIEWRVLDAQYFGVPQRRRRVFVVAVFDLATAARCPDPLLPVEQGVRGDTAQGATARQGAPGEADASTINNDRVQGFGNNNFGKWAEIKTAIALAARDYKGSKTLALHCEDSRRDSVRRLTPLECERLMGWPDNWTAGQSDTHRYKQCGNGVASPVAQWIGEHCKRVAAATAGNGALTL